MDTDPRFETQSSSPTPPPDPGPAVHHRLHGAIPLADGNELRMTSQSARDEARPARICVRRWGQRPNGVWWPVSNDRGIVIDIGHAEAFSEAVAAAARYLLTVEANPDHGRNGGDQ